MSLRGNSGGFFFSFHLTLKLKHLNFEKYSYFSHLPQGKNWLAIKELIPKIPREDEALCDVNSICTLYASDMQEHSFFCLRICILLCPDALRTDIIPQWQQGSTAPQPLALRLRGRISDRVFCHSPDNTVAFLTLCAFSILFKHDLAVVSASLSLSMLKVSVDIRCWLRD